MFLNNQHKNYRKDRKKFTENKELMELVLKRIKSEDLYYIDSLTSNKSYGYSRLVKLIPKTPNKIRIKKIFL